VGKVVTERDEEEETLRQRTKHLKERKRIREERHRLEAQLREKLYKRFVEMEQRTG